jgi:RNA polymerase sigma factor (sigma-70 family)
VRRRIAESNQTMPMATLPGFLQRLKQMMAAEALASYSDHELLHGFLTTRDEAAFRALLSRHGPMVFRVCRAILPSDQDAEDTFQASFLVLARKAGVIRKRASLASWLHGVAYRIALEARAGAARRRKHEAQAGKAIRPVAFPDETTWKELRSLLDEQLHRLPERLRAPLVMCFLEGLTQDEAARQLGQSKATLRRNLERGRELLAVRLSRRGFTLSAALCVPLLTGGTASAAPPPGVFVSTIEAEARIVAGKATGAAVSAKVAALTKGALKTMLLTKLKGAAAVLLAVIVLGAAFTVYTYQAPAQELAQVRKTEIVQKSGATPDHPANKEWRELFALKHEDAVTAVAANGTMIAVADEGCRLRLWDARAGKELEVSLRGARFTKPADTLRFMANDGYLVMSGPASGVVRYKLVDGAMVGEYSGLVTLAGFSADLNTLVARDRDRPSRLNLHGNLWTDPSNLSKTTSVVEAPDGVAVAHVALSANGQRLAVAGDDSVIRIYDGRAVRGALRELHKVNLKMGQKLTAVRLSDDGKRLAVIGVNGFAQVTDADGARLCELKGHDGTVAAVAFTPDGSQMATACGKVVRLFDSTTGKLVGQIVGHADSVKVLAFSQDGSRLITGSQDKTARVWVLKE